MFETIGAAFLARAEDDDCIVRFWQSQDKAPIYRYPALASDALRVSGALISEGMKPGERVAIVLPTDPDFYRAYFGVILAGGVPVPLYPPVRLGRIAEWKERTAAMLTATTAIAVITELRLIGLLGAPVRKAGPKLGCRTVKGLLKEGTEATPVLGKGSDLATIQFSSGSTGDPKPVALSHWNMLSNTAVITDTFPRPIEEQSGLTWLPLYHDMGLIGNLLTAMVAPGDLTLIGPERFVARPRIWLEALTATKATISAAPNFAFGLCLAKIGDDELDGLDLSNWSLALCGAEPVHPTTLQGFAEKFAQVGFRRSALTPVYGLAEATLAATFSKVDEVPIWTRFDAGALEKEGVARVSDDGDRKLCSLGSPLPGVDLAIRDEADIELPTNRLGTVWLSGDGIMTGYFDRPEATAEIVKDGWLNTGDQGFVHEGNLYLCGRLKDLIIIRGRNHDPALVEQAVDAVDGMRTGCTAAFGVDDEEAGTERLIVLAEAAREVPAVDYPVLAEASVRAIRHVTGLNPEHVIVLAPGTLPRTSSGKIRRSEAHRQYLATELTPPRKAGFWSILFEQVVGLLNQLRAKRRRAES
jgi:acyl-CoA synthetase (AMP-forming)/AMP-acid ligase II